MNHSTKRNRSGRRFHFFILFPVLALLVVAVFSTGRAEDSQDEAVRDFFRSIEDAFRRKYVPDIMRNVNRDFSYTMTYTTDGVFTYLQSDAEKYRESLGAFFKSKPVIHEYTITVRDIQRTGDDVMVLAEIRSVVELSGIVNDCTASSNYHLSREKGRLVIRDVRGDASCANRGVDGPE